MSFFLDLYKMEEKILIFGEKYINKNKFHMYEKPIDIDKVDIKRMVLSNKGSYGNKGLYKYFIGHIHEIKALSSPLHIKVPQMNAYAKCFDKNYKCINLNDKEILGKYNYIWNEIKILFGKKFDSEPVYNDKYIKVKINLCNTNFYDNKARVEGKHAFL